MEPNSGNNEQQPRQTPTEATKGFLRKFTDRLFTDRPEFLQNVSLQALLDLLNTLPQDKKDQLQQKIANMGNDTVKIQEELKAYFTDSQFEQAIENSAKNAVTEYIKAINPTLSEIQKTGIANFAKELNQNNPPAQVTL